MYNKIVFSCQADFQNIALQEILNINAGIKFISWLDFGVGLVEYSGTFSEFSELLKENRLIFTRHIFPAEYIIPYDEIEKQDFISYINKEENFSVQIRAAGDKTYNTSGIKQKITDYLKSEGYAENKRYPEQIISIFVSNDLAYMGFSHAEENLSIWSGGMRHYAFREDTISRAGFKLKEALEAYPAALEKGGAALDLGAAPGGWTKVLVEAGFKVAAVDPVLLSPVLQKNENVEYHNIRAHEYIKNSDKLFDLIVNDMSMNIMTSINFIMSLRHRLRDKGYVILTFKLTKQDRINKINEGIKQLSKKFDVVFIKQLFHNRSEVTVILQKN